MKKISYALGMSIGANFLSSGIKEVDMDEFTKAMKLVLANGKSEMTFDEAQQTVTNFFEGLQGERSDLTQKAGEEFLKINAKKTGVTTLDSGLQYEVLKKGEGKQPLATDKVKCHYHGTLINGAVFDSSVERGEPAEFGVNQVIQGWVEALQLMSEGSKWKLTIPYHLAYGTQGAGQMIEPYSTLIFEVELLKVI